MRTMRESKKVLKPARLEPGDLVGIIAPASAPPNPKAIEACVEAVRALGYQPLLGKNAHKRLGFLAGSDRERAADIMHMFGHPKVKAIFCVRGGYGSSRLVPLLDFDTIRQHPKILVGYSDITSLHCALLRRANLVSFHGPMLNSDWIKESVPAFTKESFLRVLSRPEPAGSICTNSGGAPTIIRKGAATGQLIGGNLTLLCATLGTTYQPPFRNRILFLEDLDEAPYRFDRMLTQLLNAGLLQQLAGIAIGINKNCTDPKQKTAREYRQTLEDVFKERLARLNIPVISGLPFGHIRQIATLPVGVQARLQAGGRGDLEIVEAAVS